jgi:tripartite-type tricarboxylate transporter receptor subunit TctC
MRPSLLHLALGALLVVAATGCTPNAPRAGSAAKPAANPAGQASAPALRPDYFAGKTVTLLVNYSPGGPTDVFARLLAQHLDRHIPGKPTIVVENKPGAGGAIGINHHYNVSKKDGLTIGVFTPHFSGQLLDAEGVQFDESKFLFLGATTESQVSFINPSIGARTMRELPQATGEIVAGGLSPDSSKDMAIRNALNLLGVKYKYVTGYPGNSDIRAAFQRGEVNYVEESLTGWFTGVAPMVSAGTAVGLGQRGTARGGQIVRDPRVSDIPTYLETAIELKGEAVKQSVEYRALLALIAMSATSREVVYPPGTDPAVVQAMRQAMNDTFADPEFAAAAEKILGFQMDFLPGPEAGDLAVRIVQDAGRDPEALEYLKRLTKEKS